MIVTAGTAADDGLAVDASASAGRLVAGACSDAESRLQENGCDFSARLWLGSRQGSCAAHSNRTCAFPEMPGEASPCGCSCRAHLSMSFLS